MAAPLPFASVVFAGTALDGGLYVPTRIPTACLTPALLDALEHLPYHRVAARLLALWITEAEIPLADLLRLTGTAYSEARWGRCGEGEGGGGAVAPLVPLAPASASAPRVDVVELFHGPTAAFKDAALQLLGCLIPYLMARPRTSTAASAIPTRVTVLGATSGDTGAAAVAGLRGAQGVTLLILHPAGKVAPVQHMQMCSVLDANVHNVAVGGADFDACQGAVKGAFADPAFVARHNLCAINSINWARVLAQSIYYVFSHVAWRAREKRAGRGVAPEVSGCAAGVGPARTFFFFYCFLPFTSLAPLPFFTPPPLHPPAEFPHVCCAHWELWQCPGGVLCRSNAVPAPPPNPCSHQCQ